MTDDQWHEEFGRCDDADPALPGDPWSHLRYHYGQLLGAEDFSAEQRAFILRHRLHLALLHGVGTVWGLRVEATKIGMPPSARLTVEPGLAVDSIGREIYVNETQCLDVGGLHATELWDRLDPVPGYDGPADVRDVKRVYVVLCYDACLSHPVPAITPPCSDADDALSFGRVNERFRIDLVAQAPAASELQRAWLPAAGPPAHDDAWRTPRDRLLDHLLGAGSIADLARFWRHPDKTPLVLAAVDLEKTPQGDGATTAVLDVRNEVRALLPPVQLVAEQLFGQRLAGADERAPLKVLAIEEDHADSAKPAIAITFSEHVTQAVMPDDAIAVFRRHNGTWQAASKPPQFAGGAVVSVELKAPANWTEGTVYQVHLNGSARQPIATIDGRPLAGWWDEPVPPRGRGRDVSIIETWGPDI